MNAQRTRAQLERTRIAAIIRATDGDRAARAADAVISGGFTIIELTLNTPGAIDLIARLAGRPGLVIGAGTVMTADQVRQAADAGARFIVSPHVDASVISAALACGAVVIPGAYTPTEMCAARRAGAHWVKLFPAPADIASYVRQVRGPFADMPVFPTAGVTPENFIDILKAGAVGVGFVSSLFRPDEMQAGDFDAIRARARSIVTTLRDTGIADQPPG